MCSAPSAMRAGASTISCAAGPAAKAIVHSWINKALEKAQQKVEARNFDMRKNLLKFDNVSNDQRKVIFDQRIEWMRMGSVAEIVADMRHVAIDDLVAKHVPENAY